MKCQSSQDLATQSAKQLTHAFLHPQPAGSFYQVSDEKMLAIEQLSAIFEGALPLHKTITVDPQSEITNIDTPPRVQITV
jgi:hypothetical protein